MCRQTHTKLAIADAGIKEATHQEQKKERERTEIGAQLELGPPYYRQDGPGEIEITQAENHNRLSHERIAGRQSTYSSGASTPVQHQLSSRSLNVHGMQYGAMQNGGVTPMADVACSSWAAIPTPFEYQASPNNSPVGMGRSSTTNPPIEWSPEYNPPIAKATPKSNAW